MWGRRRQGRWQDRQASAQAKDVDAKRRLAPQILASCPVRTFAPFGVLFFLEGWESSLESLTRCALSEPGDKRRRGFYGSHVLRRDLG